MPEVPDNPFAIRRPARRGFGRPLKWLAFAAVLLSVSIVAQSQARQWLLHRWAAGMADLPVSDQIERLLQINALGDMGIETLARRLGADDDRVAATALELLRDRQSDWATRSDDSMARAHAQMLDGLAAIIDELPERRAAWVNELLSQTIVECVDQRGAVMKRTYAKANDLAGRIAGRIPQTDAAGGEKFAPEIAADSRNRPVEEREPSLVPLPVRLQTLGDEIAGDGGSMTEAGIAAAPTIVARGSRFDAVGTGDSDASRTVHRIDPDAPRQADSDADAAAEYSAGGSLQAFTTRSVISLLADRRTAVRDRAVEELVRRGLTNEQIRLANQLAAPQFDVRLGLLESILPRSDIDPRPWLLWLAEDSSREIRLRAVAALAAMNDRAVGEALRGRMAAETDPDVVAQLQKVIRSR